MILLIQSVTLNENAHVVKIWREMASGEWMYANESIHFSTENAEWHAKALANLYGCAYGASVGW